MRDGFDVAKPTAAQVVYGGADEMEKPGSSGLSLSSLSDYDKPLVKSVADAVDRLPAARDPSDVGKVVDGVRTVRQSYPHVEPHLPTPALKIYDAFQKEYASQQKAFAATGATETPDDRTRFRDAAHAKALDHHLMPVAAKPQQPAAQNSPALPDAAVAASAAATWPGAQAGPDGSLIFRPQPGATAGERGSGVGDVAGKAAMAAIRQLVPRVAGGVGMLIPSPGVEREITTLGEDLRFSVPTGELRGRLERRDPDTGEWSRERGAEIGIDPQGNRFIKADPPPTVTPPAPPPGLPDRVTGTPHRQDPRTPGFPAEPQEPYREEIPQAEPLPDGTVFPNDSDELSDPDIQEQRYIDPIPLGRGHPLPDKTTDALDGIQNKEWRKVFEKTGLGSGGLDAYGGRVTNITRPGGTLDEARKDLQRMADELGLKPEEIRSQDPKTGKSQVVWEVKGPDDMVLKVREKSNDGRPTLELVTNTGKYGKPYYFKIRYGDAP